MDLRILFGLQFLASGAGHLGKETPRPNSYPCLSPKETGTWPTAFT